MVLNKITVRKMPFEFAEDIDPVFIDGDYARSYRFIAGSLLLPHLEPYLIRSMRAAEPHVTDPVVLDGLRSFVRQEAQHYQMHKKFNDTVRLSGFPELASFEKELSDDYHRFTRTKSLRFNLAYAEGFEALTMNTIRHMMGSDGFGEDLPPFMQLIEWHFVEELEHRTVAFDVYDHVCGGYGYRLAVGIWAQWHFTSWISRVSRYMLKTRPPAEAPTGKTASGTGKLKQGGLASSLSMLPSLLSIYLPNYSPHKIEIPPGIQALADKYTAMAIKTA